MKMNKDDNVHKIIVSENLYPIMKDKVEHLYISSRPLYMCRFGCPEYSKYPSCPPHTGTFNEKLSFWHAYQLFILVTTEDSFTSSSFMEYKRHFQRKLISVERKLRASGLWYAFALFPGSCSLCKLCEMPNRCLRPQDVRPALCGMGVEIIKYMREMNISLHTNKLFSIILLD